MFAKEFSRRQKVFCVMNKWRHAMHTVFMDVFYVVFGLGVSLLSSTQSYCGLKNNASVMTMKERQ
jgi:hypothetical protein